MNAGMDSLVKSVVASSLIAVVLPGCGQTDLSEYRPVKQTSQHSSQAESTATVASIPNATPQTSADSVDDPRNAIEENLPVSALVPVNVIDGASVSNLLKGMSSGPVAENKVIQPASATNSGSDKPRSVELLIPDKTFQKDNASKAWRVSYDDLDLLKVLNLEPVTSDAVDLMPAWLRELSGQRIRIRGFMYPTFEAEGLERFVLARDNQICCFGREAKVYDLVQVDLRPGKTTRYIPPTRAFDVVGQFKIDLISVDGKPFGLYYIEDAEIIER